MYISSFQLSKETNFEILCCNLEHVLFLHNFAEKIAIMESCNCSVGQCLQASNEALMMLAFKSLFPI